MVKRSIRMFFPNQVQEIYEGENLTPAARFFIKILEINPNIGTIKIERKYGAFTQIITYKPIAFIIEEEYA